jgi:carboxyl-terminal processing protease
MRLRREVLLGAVFAAGVAAGAASILVGREGSVRLGMPAARAQEATNPDTYRWLSLFGRVFEIVRADYVQPVPDHDLIENALNGMLTGLDPHSSYMTPKAFRDMQAETRGRFGGLGLEVTQENGLIKVVSPIDDTPASRAGIKPGDLIVLLDGKSVQGMSLTEAVDQMRGNPGTSIKLTIKRIGVEKPVEVTLTREIIHTKVVRDRLIDDVGYIRLTSFDEQAAAALRQAVSSLQQQAGNRLRGFVLDLRNNPGGLLDQAVAVSNEFLDGGEIVSTRGRHTDDAQSWYAKPNRDLINGLPLVVLINSGSASASEIVAGALQDDHRAILLGTRSFGKGSVQTVIPLEGDGAIRLTTARYYTPSGRSIQGVGIAPDVEVHESRTEEARFWPAHEADLSHVLAGTTGDAKAQQPPPPRQDLPPIAKQLPHDPPPGWPTLDPDKPATDFQLQQAVVLIRAMAPQGHAAAK